MVGTITSLGVGSGLDLTNILDQLREVDNQAVNLKQARVTTAEASLEEFTVVKNKLLDMKSKALDLSLTGTYLKRAATSSDESVVTTQVTDGAVVRRSYLEVSRLAAKSSWLSDGLATTDASVNTQGSDQAFSYQVGEDSIVVTVPDGTTLSQLVDLINDDADNPGVTASLINDGDPATPYRLFLQANDTGEENRIEALAWLPDLAMTEQEGAAAASLNAAFTVDGIDYQRQSNTFSDVLSGVIVTVNDIGGSTINVTRDDGAVLASITGLVEAYNDAVQEIRKNTAYDEATGDFGVLGRTSLRDLPFNLQNLMTTSYIGSNDLVTRSYDATTHVVTVTDGNIYSLFDLGLVFDQEGLITIDENVLKSAWADHADQVQALFLGDEDAGIVGLADRINEQLRTVTGGTGQIEGEKTAAQNRIDALEAHIETMTARLDKKYELMTRQFAALDTFMSQMTSVGNYLSSQFDSLSSALSGGKK